MEKKVDEEVKVNKKALEYYAKYAQAKYIPLTNYKATSLFQTYKSSIDTISQEDVTKWLKNPTDFYTKLIGLSQALYETSGEYRGLINYHADMARFFYVLDPIYSDTESMKPTTVKKELSKLSSYMTKMNIKHELAKAYFTCLLEDVFFGYEIEDKDNYFILKLDPQYCRINGMADGMYTFEFDLSFFNGRKHIINTFPEEFKEAFQNYQLNKDKKVENGYISTWFELDFTKSVCFKANELTTKIIPPFSTMFEPLMELNDYKKLKKVGAKINNYMLLHQKVPMHDNDKKDYQADNFAISTESMDFFNEMVNESLPDEIGAIVSPMEITPINLSKDDKTDKVAEATRDVYNSAGVSSFLFNNDKNSTGGLQYSVRKDELFVINFYRQVERWLNRKIRFSNLLTKTQWRITLIDVTGMSEDKHLDLLIQAGTLGFPVRGRVAAMLGLDYHTLSNALQLESEVLDLDMKMIPFASSHTGGLNAMEQGKDNTGGRPVDEKVSDTAQANRDSNSNALKGGGK